MFARPYETLVAPARLHPQLWRLAVGLVLSVAIYLAWVAGIFALVALWPDADSAWMRAQWVGTGATPLSLLILLATFGGMALGPLLAVRLLHKRPGASLFGPTPRLIHDFTVALGVVIAVLGLSVAVWLLSYAPLPGLDPGLWLLLLPLALLGVLIQTGAEEILFRGYLQSQLAARFAHPVVWAVLPACLFGAVHYDPANAGGSALLIVASATLFGLLAADLTARTGSLGAAWGFHFGNNCLALLVIATQGTLEGLALWRTPYSIAQTDLIWPLVLVDLALTLAIWGILRRLLSR